LSFIRRLRSSTGTFLIPVNSAARSTTLLIDAQFCAHPRSETIAECNNGQESKSPSFTLKINTIAAGEPYKTLAQLGITHRRTAYHHPEGNSYIERFHRSLKEEEVWTAEYRNVHEARASIARWIQEYNHDRPHRGLENRTPHEAFLAFAVLTKNEALTIQNHNIL
jgi:transposase InsO family protein